MRYIWLIIGSKEFTFGGVDQTLQSQKGSFRERISRRKDECGTIYQFIWLTIVFAADIQYSFVDALRALSRVTMFSEQDIYVRGTKVIYDNHSR